ncbi:fatty acyl-CoA reductase wat-like [Chrysoperla carnea]|uniref:fatty acyl-CoA reductase wat-like n=1 Tax=Chrysoperla carnea TaxID=189513 RepID=UPI001D088472|nr:fatty acyl-CoA reductase wat-like [Chrysoperla carnea]
MDFTDERFIKLRKLASKLQYEDWKSKQHVEINYKLPKLLDKNLPTIKEFYKNQNVFITGGNGFMGKVLIEKLLRSCPDLNKIYLLIRVKKGIKPEERLADMLQNPVFDRMKKENPNGISKLEIIYGDCEKPNLGMSDEIIEKLKENVNIIFHAAASVRFDDPLKKALLMNTRSTRDLVSIAKKIRNLKVFVHLSTAYCNIDKETIDEKVYPRQANWEELIQMAEKFDQHTIEILKPVILNGFPNTYTFTKSLAENIVNDECSNIPTVIFRPSIVYASEKEPIPGWLDNLNGPLTFIAGCGTGLSRVFFLNPDLSSDFIPVDNAIINMIVASWYQANNTKKRQSLVINACTANYTYFSYQNANYCGVKLVEIYPFTRQVWYPIQIAVKNKYLFHIIFLFCQIIPSIITQILVRLAGRNFPIMKLCRKSYIANIALGPFVQNEWLFKNGNYLSLCKVLKEADKNDFIADITQSEPFTVAANGIYGLKKYVLKENPDDKVSLLKARALSRKYKTSPKY